jgi:excisionase family DNA binding protein
MAGKTDTPNQTLLTVYEVQMVLRCSSSTVHNYIKSGQLAGIKSGRLLRIPSASVFSFLEEHFIDGTTRAAAQNALNEVTDRVVQDQAKRWRDQ